MCITTNGLLIVCESIYSMCGSIGPIKETCDLAEQHGALIFLDEVRHIENDGKVFILNNDASGSCCPRSAGVAEHLDYDAHLAAGQIPFPWIALISSLLCHSGWPYWLLRWYHLSRRPCILTGRSTSTSTRLVPYASVILSDHTRNLTFCSDSPASTSFLPHMPPWIQAQTILYNHERYSQFQICKWDCSYTVEQVSHSIQEWKWIYDQDFLNRVA